MIRRNVCLIALPASLCAALSAPAQITPPIETGTPTVTLRPVGTGAGFQLVDAADGTLIFDGAEGLLAFQDPAVEFNTQVQQQPTGVDLIITATNPTQAAHRLGSFVLATFRLGQQIQYRDFRYAARVLNADYLNYVGQAHHYPDSLYSPVWVMSNARYTVGLSFLYPILAYQHDVRIGMGSPGFNDPRDPRRGWLMEFRLGAHDANDGVLYSAVLQPGETRTYVITLRVQRNPSEWIRTLTPYRNYFRQTYGGVKYDRDPRPVKPHVFSAPENVSAQNPNGYTFATSRRPDIYGWRPWGDALVPLVEQWGRVMVWAPSGSYGADRSFNYPYQFASHWLDDPESATVDDPAGLPAAAHVGELGLWWGYSVRVATRWNPTLPSDVHPFDPDNAADLAAAYLELDTAARAGATRIGLDSFAHYYCPAWKLHRWLRAMKTRHPQIHFVSEAVTSDILHNEDPTYLCGYNANNPSSPTDLYPITTPHYLADFVNPGHEIWIAYQYDNQRRFGMAVTPAMVESDAERFASWGYVPLMFDDFAPGPATLAAESWRNTVPADLQQAVQWNSNYDRSRALPGPNGRPTIVGGSQAPVPGGGPQGESAPVGGQSGSRSTSVNNGVSTRAGHGPRSGGGGGGGGISGSRSVPSPGGGASGGSGDQGSAPAQNGAPPQPAARPADAGPAAPLPAVPEFVPRDVLRKLIEDALKRAKAQQAGQPAPPPTPAPGDH